MKEKYSLVIASGLIQFASWYCFDLPATINKSFSEYIKLSPEKVSLYSYISYAFPNIICTILFGYFISIKRVRLVTVLCLFIVVGHCIFLFGFLYKSLVFIILGRIVAGIGGENFTINQNKRITTYFKGKELAVALSAFNIIGKLGMLSTYMITPIIITKLSPVYAVGFGVLLTLFGLIIGFVVDTNDTHSEMKQIIQETKNPNFEIEDRLGTIDSYKRTIPQTTMTYDTILKSENIWDSQDSYPMEVHKKLEIPEIRNIYVDDDVLFVKPGIKASEKIHFSFYVYVFMVLVFTFAWAPFYTVATFLFQKKFQMTNLKACNVLAMIEIFGILCYFGVSFFADYFGYKIYIIILGLILILVGHTAIFFNKLPAMIAGLFFSFGVPFFNCHWPCISSLINSKKVGVGYACAISAMNVGYVVSPLILSTFVENDFDYNLTYLYIIGLTGFALLVAFFLMFLNSKYDIRLNDPEKKKLK